MPQLRTCERGHRWSGDDAAHCPVCESNRVTLAGADASVDDAAATLPISAPLAPDDATVATPKMPLPQDYSGSQLHVAAPPRDARDPDAPPSLSPLPGPLTRPTVPAHEAESHDTVQGALPPATAAKPADPLATRPGDTLARGDARSTMTARPGLEVPKLPGYKFLGVLGRGGMGVVYKARQVKLDRLVALKMVLSGVYAAPAELARFQAEAEAVARLQHPNIVQIYEINDYQGLPYLALEYVEGGSLQQRLDGTPMAPREAAALVATLAGAMDYAHRRGIVHRDLKPANILLASGGRQSAGNAATTGGLTSAARQVPKITDFGLAKRVEGDSGQTRTGNILGTPSYMAPEQATGRNREVGPGADIYSLGAILYDLLTGRPPFKGETILDTLQQVQTNEPLPPRRLQPTVPRDLETICLKCLEKQRDKRYASAGALADDLERFLDHQPILARPTPWWERAAKWAQRRPAVASLLATLALTLTIAFIALFILWRQAEYERDDALKARDERERQRVLALKARDEKEAARVLAVNAQIEAEKQRDRADKNLQQAFTAGQVLLTRVAEERLLKEPRMEGLRKEILLKAVQFYEGFYATEGATVAVRSQAARAHRRVGDIQEMLGNYAAAQESYEQAITLLDGLSKEAPGKRDYRPDLADAHSQLGIVLQALQQPARAEAEYKTAIALLEQLRQIYPGGPEHVRNLATAWSRLADLYMQQPGRAAEADTAFAEALRRLRQLHAEYPSVRDYHAELAKVLANYGVWLQVQGSPDAEKVDQESLDLLTGLT